MLLNDEELEMVSGGGDLRKNTKFRGKPLVKPDEIN